MPQITANGISIEYETHGNPSDPPLLLVMGLGAQLTLWPIELVEALVGHGYYVIRHDNRDIGLSEKFGHAGIPNFRKVALLRMFGIRTKLPYRLSDMADDAAGLLDALGIDSAHVVGASMGGMIAQLMAINHPARVRSLTSIFSTTGNPRLPRPKPEAMQALLDRAPPGATLDDVIQIGIRVARAIGSPAYPTPEDRLRERIARDFQRSFYPEGPARQIAAIIDDGDRRKRLKTVTAPTLVIHGTDDPLVPVEGGRDTARAIPGAKLHEIPGMGHDLPLELVDEIAAVIAAHAR
ncbi:MAG: alpha/beta fold hydrolase [Novosphingobium sp.]